MSPSLQATSISRPWHAFWSDGVQIRFGRMSVAGSRLTVQDLENGDSRPRDVFEKDESETRSIVITLLMEKCICLGVPVARNH